MRFDAIAVLISAATLRRNDTPRAAAAAPAAAQKSLADLNDHHLRDIGFVRERVIVSRGQLMRM